YRPGPLRPGAEEYIMESLEWCGIRIDEGVREGGSCGPYRQSDRQAIYRQYVDQLLISGWAYYAFDTAEELEERRRQAEGTPTGGAFAYDAATRMGMRNSLSLPEGEVDRLLKSGIPYVIRFKMPADEEVVMQDLIRGEVRVNTNTLDDKVLFKSDGMPTYHLANVVDDHLMEITHVIRGEEWLPSLPLHVMLYKGFGWTGTMPQFAHLPLILKPSGNGKLSKRDGDKLGFPVFPINWTNPETNEIYSGYREAGYFPEAFVNILALLGWNDGTDQEIYSMEELIGAFSLERVGKSGSRFDPDKARWFNHQYMMMKGDEEVAREFARAYGQQGVRAYGGDEDGGMQWERLVKIISLVKERAVFLKDLWDQAWFFFEAPKSYDETTIKKRWTPETPVMLRGIASLLKPLSPQTLMPLSPEAYETLIKGFIAEQGLNTGLVMNLLRLCLVGAPMGPGVFDIMSILGPEETARRILKAVEEIKAQ
ncbi:MAG: glutamate--tRNA ligase, partial [Bacteroidales bacterium]